MPFRFVFLPPQQNTTRAWARVLAASFPEWDVVVPETMEDAQEAIREADAAFGTIPPDLLQSARRLRWLQAPAAAPPAGYYYPELVEHPVEVTNFRGIFNDHIATHILAFVLAFARGLHRYIPHQVRGEWNPLGQSIVVHLPDAKALILGLGEIGAETARLCSAFGMEVVGVDARREDCPEGVLEMHRPDALDRLLPRADFVILTVPHTPETEHMIDATRLAHFKPGAFLINIGRGMTVRLHDVVEALRSGRLGGAGLDVYEIEPLPADHPLWTAPNVLLTPHVAGEGPYLDERRLEIILDNARHFADGQPLRNIVDKKHWY